MSTHIGLKLLVSIGNILESEVKSKARGIHHYYKSVIQELVDVYEAQIRSLADELEVISKKSLKYILPTIPLPRGVKLPKHSYLCAEESICDPKLIYDPKPNWKPQIMLVERCNYDIDDIVLPVIESNSVVVSKSVVVTKPVIDSKPAVKPEIDSKPAVKPGIDSKPAVKSVIDSKPAVNPVVVTKPVVEKIVTILKRDVEKCVNENKKPVDETKPVLVNPLNSLSVENGKPLVDKKKPVAAFNKSLKRKPLENLSNSSDRKVDDSNKSGNVRKPRMR